MDESMKSKKKGIQHFFVGGFLFLDVYNHNNDGNSDDDNEYFLFWG